MASMHRRELRLAGVVDGFGQEAGGFLRGVKTLRAVGVHEVDAPLRLGLESERGIHARARGLGALDLADGRGHLAS